jgi:hypothetical protein
MIVLDEIVMSRYGQSEHFRQQKSGLRRAPVRASLRPNACGCVFGESPVYS